MDPREIDQIMEDAVATFRQRNSAYGGAYLHHGKVLAALFPDGITVNNDQDFSQLMLVHNIVTKLARYCNNIGKGGHKDSAHDMMVYSAMMEKMTYEVKR